MVAAFEQLAVLQHDDAVRLADGGQTMRDDETGAAFEQLHQRFLDQHFCVAVDIRRSFVEHEDLGVGDKGAGEADELALAE